MIHHTARLAFAAASLLCLASTAQAADAQRALPHLAAHTTELGNNTTALTYWVAQANGLHVVTTVDTVQDDAALGSGRHSVVRFSALIAPGQSQVISVPGPSGAAPQELRIQRIGDSIEVIRAPAVQLEAANGVVTN